MSLLGIVLLLVILVLLIGAWPSMPYWQGNAGYGYWPSGLIGVVLLIIIVLLIFGRI
jgi:hypothetical protein